MRTGGINHEENQCRNGRLRVHGQDPFERVSCQAANFFDLPFQPVLKTICARNADRAKAFAANWGYENFETDWRRMVESPEIDLIDIASPNDTHLEIALAAARAGKMVMCEKPLGRNRAGIRTDGEGGGRSGRRQHGLVQLPASSGGDAGEATDRRRTARQDFSLSREVFAGLDDLDRTAAGRGRAVAAGRLAWRAAV